jgi:hypothetical protein
LLKGLGTGLAQQAAQMREDALLKLKRQYQLEDQQTEEQQQIRKEDRQEQRDVRQFDREADLKTGLLALAQTYKQAEGETEQAYKERLLRIRGEIESGQIEQKGKIDKSIKQMEFSNDKALAVLKADLDKRNDAASQQLKEQIDRGESTVAGRTPDGYIIIKRGDGTLITTKTKMAAPGKSEDDGATIEDYANGKPAAAKPAVTPSPRPPAKPVKTEPKATVRQMQNSVDGMLASGSIPPGQAVGQTLTAPDGTVLTWDGKRWKVPGA